MVESVTGGVVLGTALLLPTVVTVVAVAVVVVDWTVTAVVYCCDTSSRFESVI